MKINNQQSRTTRTDDNWVKKKTETQANPLRTHDNGGGGWKKKKDKNKKKQQRSEEVKVGSSQQKNRSKGIRSMTFHDDDVAKRPRVRRVELQTAFKWVTPPLLFLSCP